MIYDASLDDLLQKVWDGKRISPAEALRLYHLPLEELGALADRRRQLAKAKDFDGRGNDIVTNFPGKLELTLVIFDMPCDMSLRHAGAHVYLTDEMIRSLRLSFYWKRGLEMRPARGISVKSLEVSPIARYYQGAADPPPQRYEWLLDFDVPSEGVPLTDSLVLVVRTPDHHIVARTAARL